MPETQNPLGATQSKNQTSVKKDRSFINWEKFLIYTSGLLFIIIILIFGYWFFELRPQVEKQLPVQTEELPKETLNPDSTELNQLTKNWIIISEGILGIELKQPPDWSVETNSQPKRFLFMENKSDWDLEKYQEIILASPNYTSTILEDGGEEIKSGSRIIVIPFKNSVLFSSLDKINTEEIGARDFEKNIFIDNQKAKRIDYTLDTAFYFTEVYVLNNGKAFLIFRNYLEGERSVYEEVFNGVLESLKFTK